MTAPGDGHVCEAPVDQLRTRPLGIDLHEHAIGDLSLAAVACDGTAVVQVSMLASVECDGAAGIQTYTNLTLLVDLLDGAHLAIRHTLLPVRGRELDAVARRKGPIGPPDRPSRRADGADRTSPTSRRDG